MLGRISPSRIRQRATPSASAAATKSRSTTGCAAPRVTRATRGIVVRPTASTISQFFAPSVVIATSASMICGNARMTSISAHQHVVEAVARVGGDEPDEDAEHEAEDASRCAATASSWPPPQRNRLQTSWPMWSVPKSRFDGRVLGWPTNAVGEWGAR